MCWNKAIFLRNIAESRRASTKKKLLNCTRVQLEGFKLKANPFHSRTYFCQCESRLAVAIEKYQFLIELHSSQFYIVLDFHGDLMTTLLTEKKRDFKQKFQFRFNNKTAATKRISSVIIKTRVSSSNPPNVHARFTLKCHSHVRLSGNAMVNATISAFRAKFNNFVIDMQIGK